MARSGGKRTYVRDANGRFASTPGGGSKSLAAARKAARPTSGRKSTLQARTSLKKSRAKLAAKDPADQRLSTALSARAQKGAVTRGSKALKTAKADSRVRISSGRKGVVNKPKGLKPGDLVQRQKLRTRNPIISTPKKPLRKAKSPAQVVDQANKLLDRLKLQMFNNLGGARRYKLEARIAKVNKSTKQIVPSYRHNPMRKGSLAKSAYAERNRKYGKNARSMSNIGRGSEFFRYGNYMA